MKKEFKTFEVTYFDPEKKSEERTNFLSSLGRDTSEKDKDELSSEERLKYLKFYAKSIKNFYAINENEAYAKTVVNDEELENALLALKEKPLHAARNVTEMKYFHYRLEPTGEEKNISWTKNSFDPSIWHEGDTPLIVNKYRPLDIKGEWEQEKNDELVLIDFECIVDGYELYVNGNYVQQHDGYEPHAVDITKHVKPGQPNQLALRIPTKEYQPIGIGGKVKVLGLNKSYINNVFVATKEIRSNGESVLEIKATLNNTSDTDFCGIIAFTLTPWFPEEAAEKALTFEKGIELKAGGQSESICQVTMNNSELWSVERPFLYKAEVTLFNDKNKAVDGIIETFGIRSIEEKNGHIYMNGNQLFVKSFGDTFAYDDSPKFYGNLWPADNHIVKDMMLIKRANGNCMRIHHWGSAGVPGSYCDNGWPEYGKCINGTNYERFADIADQLGICLIWITRHWCNWPSGFVYHFEPEFMEERLTKSIEKVRNHPSIVMYEGLNEVSFLLNQNYMFPTNVTNHLTPGGLSDEERDYYKERYQGFIEKFIDLVNKVDGTRLINPDSPWGPFFKVTPETTMNAGLVSRLTVRDESNYYKKNCVWALHTYSGWYGTLHGAWNYAKIWNQEDKEKPVLLNEFGAEAMPKWELYRNHPWYGVWITHHTYISKIEQAIFGRPLHILKNSEVDLSQAYQCVCIQYNAFIAKLTGCDGLNINLIGDGPGEGTYHKGVTDLYRKAKLGYFAANMSYQKLIISGVNFNFKLSPQNVLNVKCGKEVDVAPGEYTLTITVKNDAGVTVQKLDKIIELNDSQVQDLGSYGLEMNEKGLYCIEYSLKQN